MPGGPGGTVPAGSAEVHSRVTQDREPGLSARGAYDQPGGMGTPGGGRTGREGDRSLTERATDRARDLAEDAGERARELADEASERMHDLSDQAGEAASRARRRAGEAIDQAEDRIEAQTGLISTIREHPLRALGIAFGLGFMLAGSGSESKGRKRSGVMGKAQGQLKTAIMGALSAAAAEQIRSLLEGRGPDLGGAASGGRSPRAGGTPRH